MNFDSIRTFFQSEFLFQSRVFAEKCGLEAGWNCHISLARDEHRDGAVSRPSSIKPASSISNVSSRPSLPMKGRFRSTASATQNKQRERDWSVNSTPTHTRMHQNNLISCSSLPKDLKIDLPVVHFKSVAETPMVDLPPLPAVKANDDSVFDPDDGSKASKICLKSLFS